MKSEWSHEKLLLGVITGCRYITSHWTFINSKVTIIPFAYMKNSIYEKYSQIFSLTDDICKDYIIISHWESAVGVIATAWAIKHMMTLVTQTSSLIFMSRMFDGHGHRKTSELWCERENPQEDWSNESSQWCSVQWAKYCWPTDRGMYRPTKGHVICGYLYLYYCMLLSNLSNVMIIGKICNTLQ